MAAIAKNDLFNKFVSLGSSTDGRVEIGSMNDDSLIKMAKTIPEVFSNSSELKSCISLSGRATASNLEAAYKQVEAFASGLAIFADVFRERVSDPTVQEQFSKAFSETCSNADEIKNDIASRIPAGSGGGGSVPEDTDLSMIIRKYQRDGANPRPIYQVLEFFDPQEFFDKPGYIQRAIKYAQKVKEEGGKGWIIRGCCNHDLSNIKTSKEDFINYLKTFGQVETKAGTYYGIKKLIIPYSLKYSLNDDDVKVIVDHCPNLEHLDLSGCINITNEGISYLSEEIKDDKGISKARLYKLRHLNLSGCLQVNGKVLSSLITLYELTHLSLSDIKGVFDTEKETILDEHLVHLNKKLVYLNLKGSTDDLTDVGLANLSKLKDITHLFLGGGNAHFTGKGLSCLTAALVHLTRLDISNWWQISGEDLIYLTHLHNLTHLSVRNIKISDEHLVHLNKKLEYLDLNSSVGDLTDEGLTTLSKLKDITHLFLGGGIAHFTGEGLSRLTGALTKLTCLELWGLGLVDDDLTYLVRLNFLTHLLLSFPVNFNLKGLTNLSKIPNLTHLFLGNCNDFLTYVDDDRKTVFRIEVKNVLVRFPRLKYLAIDVFKRLQRASFDDARDIFLFGKAFYKNLEDPFANFDKTRRHATEIRSWRSYASVNISKLREHNNASGKEICIVQRLSFKLA